ncbi:unnamed protein product [Calypogeia fissa]
MARLAVSMVTSSISMILGLLVTCVRSSGSQVVECEHTISKNFLQRDDIDFPYNQVFIANRNWPRDFRSQRYDSAEFYVQLLDTNDTNSVQLIKDAIRKVIKDIIDMCCRNAELVNGRCKMPGGHIRFPKYQVGIRQARMGDCELPDSRSILQRNDIDELFKQVFTERRNVWPDDFLSQNHGTAEFYVQADSSSTKVKKPSKDAVQSVISEIIEMCCNIKDLVLADLQGPRCKTPGGSFRFPKYTVGIRAVRIRDCHIPDSRNTLERKDLDALDKQVFTDKTSWPLEVHIDRHYSYGKAELYIQVNEKGKSVTFTNDVLRSAFMEVLKMCCRVKDGKCPTPGGFLQFQNCKIDIKQTTQI